MLGIHLFKHMVQVPRYVDRNLKPARGEGRGVCLVGVLH